MRLVQTLRMSRKRILFERSYSPAQCKQTSKLRKKDAKIFCTLDLLARKHLLLHGHLWDTKWKWGGSQGGWGPSNSVWGMATCLLNTQVPNYLAPRDFPSNWMLQELWPTKPSWATNAGFCLYGITSGIISFDLAQSFFVIAEQYYHQNEDGDHGKHILIRKAMLFSLLPIVFVTLP